MPDVGPKLFCGHGSPRMTDPTHLHTDLADAVNLCVDSLECNDEEKAQLKEMTDYNVETTNYETEHREEAALWHIFHREVYDDIVG